MGLRDEIGEQPDVVARLVARSAEIEAVAKAVRVHHVEHVVIAARGTSDHAAIYAQYLFGIRLRLRSRWRRRRSCRCTTWSPCSRDRW